MINYEVSIDNNVLRVKKYKDKVYYVFTGKEALKEISKIVNKDMKNGKVKKENGNAVFYGENFSALFMDYLTITKYLKKLDQIRKRKLKKIVIGAAISVTISASVVSCLSKKTSTSMDSKIEMETDDKVDDIDIDSIKQEALNQVYGQMNISNIPEPKILETKVIKETPLPVIEEISPEENSDVVFVESLSNFDEGLEINVSKYDELIKKATDKWGVDFNLMRDIIKQESSGGIKENITQVEFKQWENYMFKCYNYMDNKYEKIVLTNNPENYPNIDYVITSKDFKNPYTNISVGTAIIAFLYNYYNQNLPHAVQAYNFGMTAMDAVLNTASSELNINIDDLKNNESDMRFMHYTDIYPSWYGDHEYTNHVFSKSTTDANLDDGKTYTMKYIDENNNVAIKQIIIKSAYLLNKTKL